MLPQAARGDFAESSDLLLISAGMIHEDYGAMLERVDVAKRRNPKIFAVFWPLWRVVARNWNAIWIVRFWIQIFTTVAAADMTTNIEF